MTQVRRTQAERRQTAERGILDAAMKVISERGVNGMSFAEIGAASGYSRGITAHYYGTKENLLVSLLQDVAERFNEALHTSAYEGASGLEQLVIYVQLYIERAKKRPTVARALQLMRAESLTAPPPFRKAVDEANAAAFESVRTMLETAREDGSIRADVPVEATTGVLVGALRGIVGQYLSDPDRFDIDATAAEFIRSLRTMLVGPEDGAS
jgi:AcrR family transcriptional regulator